MSDEMPMLVVPDVYSDKWPAKRLKLFATIHDWLDVDKGDDKCMHTILQEDWGALGEGEKDDVPDGGTVPQVEVNSTHIRSLLFSNYANVNNTLKDNFDEMLARDARLAAKVKDSKISVNNARSSLKKLISFLNQEAARPPADMDENKHVMTYVSTGLEAAMGTMDTAKTEQEKTADGIDEDSAANKELADRVKALENAQKDPGTKPDDIKPPQTPGTDDGTKPKDVPYPDPRDSTKDNTDSTKPPGVDNSHLGDSTKDPSGTDSTKPPGVDNSGLGNGTPNGTGGLGDTPGVGTPASYPQPASSATPGMDLGSLLAQQMMMRSLADQDRNNRLRDTDPSRYDDEIAPVPPQPVAAPVTAQPVAAQPASTAPAATQHAAAPASATSAQPTAAPGRTPGEDGSVVYTFPNGKTQKVSVTTAQGLDAAFGNHSGTDAQKAYEKTPAKWSDKKQIGQRVGDFQLMTGDVATWTNSTAILVVWPPEDGGAEGGTLEVIVKGELKPFDPKMPEIASETNSFEGFAHPNGIEVTAPADGAAPQTTPGSADQPADAAMPVAAMPAG
ncbi:hypothetical protein ACWEPH_12670 [Nocardia beijingensis]|uniref:hypothetical protein n=1 Tax=Nocardia beijingensis TaxID=95162 RepID=UPI001893E5FD|nr:hypothetical protein [Nocardia beijingensis]MBF6074586.1 hypothetical protein [Nocardia beijingensis]